MLSNLRLGCRRRPLMRFARGTLGVGSLYVCSFAVMALPGFLLFLCDFKKREQLKEKDTYPLVFCSIRMFFFSSRQSCTECSKKNPKKNNWISCRVLLYTEIFIVDVESLAVNIPYTQLLTVFIFLGFLPLAYLSKQTRPPLLMGK